MPIAVKRRSVMPVGASPNAPSMPMGINDRTYDAAQGFINQTMNTVLQIHNKAALSDMASEKADFEGFVNQQITEAAKFRAENEDTDIANGVTTYTQDWDKRYKAIQEKADKLKWQDSKNDVLNSLKVRAPAWDAQVQSGVIASRHDKARRKFTEFIDSTINTDKTADVMAENKLREKATGAAIGASNSITGGVPATAGTQGQLPQLTQREYKLQLIRQQAEILAKSGAISQDDVPVALAKADAAMAKAESDQIFNTSYGYLIDIANTDDNGQPLARPDYNRALAKVNSPTFQKAMGFDADAISKLTNMIENQRTASERLLKAEQDKTEDDFNKRKRAGETPDYDAIENSGLSAEKKESIKTAWTDYYRGKGVTDDNVLVDDLKQQAAKVYLGEMNRDKYIQKVRDAHFKDRKISDDRYDELMAKMDNPLSPEQAKIISSNVYETRQQILADVTGGITLDLGGGQSIQLGNRQASKDTELQDRLKWVNLYESQLTKWVLENKGNVGREFNQESARLRTVFTNASFAEIKEKVFESENPITDKNVYNINTQEPLMGNSDYDMEAAIKAGVKQGENGHWPDTYKLPNHITFSDESVYSGKEYNGKIYKGGHWSENKSKWSFEVSEDNLKFHTKEEIAKEFFYSPDNVKLAFPDGTKLDTSNMNEPTKEKILMALNNGYSLKEIIKAIGND